MLPTFQIRGLRFCATDLTDVSDDSYSTNLLDFKSLKITERSSRVEDTVDSDSILTGQDEDGPWADVQLERQKDYDEIIRNHPEATLAYVDEDDGDMITVCLVLYFFRLFLAILHQ